MRSLLLSVVTGASLVCGAMAAQAMPATALVDTGDAPTVTLVAQGCGPGFHRGFYGRCVPFGGYAYGRRCVVRPGLLGPRRVCRF